MSPRDWKALAVMIVWAAVIVGLMVVAGITRSAIPIMAVVVLGWAWLFVATILILDDF